MSWGDDTNYWGPEVYDPMDEVDPDDYKEEFEEWKADKLDDCDICGLPIPTDEELWDEFCENVLPDIVEEAYESAWAKRYDDY